MCILPPIFIGPGGIVDGQVAREFHIDHIRGLKLLLAKVAMRKRGHEDEFLDVDAPPAGINVTADENSFVRIVVAGFKVEGRRGNDLALLIQIGLQIVEGDGFVSGRNGVLLDIMLDVHARQPEDDCQCDSRPGESFAGIFLGCILDVFQRS